MEEYSAMIVECLEESDYDVVDELSADGEFIQGVITCLQGQSFLINNLIKHIIWQSGE